MGFAPHQISLNVPVALTEAVSNAILRGNGDDPAKHVHVRAEVDAERLDRRSRATKGAGFDLDASLVDPTMPDNLDREDGRGLFLMRKLMDSVERIDGAERKHGPNDAAPRMNDLAQVLVAFAEATGCEAAVWTQIGASTARRARRRAPRTHRCCRDSRAVADGPRTVQGDAGDVLVVRRSRTAPRLARARALHAPRHRSERIHELPPAGRHAISAVGARGRTRGQRARRAIRGDQSSLYDQRDPRPHGRARRGGENDPHRGVGDRRRAPRLGPRATTARRTRCAPSPRSASISRPFLRSTSTIRAASARTCFARSIRCSPRSTRCCVPQEASYRRGAMLSVPIMWTAPAPRGAEPLGVVNLSDRRSGQPFTAGDQKLIAAIATQIGTAIQNTRLVRVVGRAAAARARDAARARPADEAAAEQRRRRAGSDGRGARRSGRERRRRLLQPVQARRRARPA